jgi:curved DNA-binding protein CbpA
MAYRDYYAILEIGPDASEGEIRVAYRRLARRYHPDLHPERADAEARLKELNEAYEVLRDPVRRAQYRAPGQGVRIRVDTAPSGGGAPSSPRPSPPPRARQSYDAPPSHVDLSGGRYTGGGYRAAEYGGTAEGYQDPWGRAYPRTEEELLLLYLRRLARLLGGW